jgi:hypothetical protein
MTQELSYETKLIIGLQTPEEGAQAPIWLLPFATFTKATNQVPSSGNQSGLSIEKVIGAVSENPPSS